MKQNITLKQTLKTKQSFNKKSVQSLKVLSYSNDELLIYLKSKMESNPFFRYEGVEDADTFLSYDHQEKSLYDELMTQVQVSNFKLKKDVCEYLIANIDSNGYFQIPYKEFLTQSPYPVKQIKEHLSALRSFEPCGIFAFNLKDCLQIQCKLSSHTDANNGFILCNYLEDIALHRLDDLQEKTKWSKQTLESAISFIQSLNPKPAANYTVKATYTNPEFIINVNDKKIQIELLQGDLKIFVDEAISNNKIFQAQRQEINELISNVQKRNATLLQIMQSICEIQSDFFLYEKPFIPCTLHMVAEQCNLHISTISRAITSKSFEFQHRYYNLKDCFHSGGINGKSAKEIEEKIISFINEEDRKHPLSDESIKKLLHEEGIPIARRTIAKYREKNYIFNSSQRKVK